MYIIAILPAATNSGFDVKTVLPAEKAHGTERLVG